MHRKRIISFIIIIVMGIGLYLTYSFYRVFFKPNTAFYNEESYLFIESESWDKTETLFSINHSDT